MCVPVALNSIGHINSYGSFDFGGIGSGISEETRRKLIALGIDPRTVTSEAQAQILIKEIVKIRKSAKIPLPLELCQREQELISKANNLASKIGIRASNSIPLEQILKNISDKINSGNYDEFKPEYKSIDEAFKNLKQRENNIYASMNYNAALNKMMLGL